MECDPQYGAVGFNLLQAVDSVRRIFVERLTGRPIDYRGADKSLARAGRKQANVSCHNGVNFLRRPALQEELDDSSRLDDEIARVPDTLPS